MRLICGNRTLDLSRPVVMGVLNVTPDSFSDGGRYASVEAAVARGEEMVEEGAAIVDVGGESTRPGAAEVPLDEELRRVLPVVERLAARVPAVISIDTSKPEVVRVACGAGAALINDVRALRAPGALEAAAATSAGICLMHMQGEPRTMQAAPRYVDVVTEVHEFLRGRLQACLAAGIETERLAIDPGFGFGKTLEHNLRLLRGLTSLATLGRPMVAGLSRKSMIAKILARDTGERLHGSLALAAIAVMNGARVVRAHDVAATVDAVRIAAAVLGDREEQ
jgi:dihydropteroate synthase